MRIITIEGLTEELKDFEKATFIISRGRIFSDSRSMGFIPRSDMTMERLAHHIDNMKGEGFTVKEYLV